ncbi:iron chelate uptake ABC transporter family permease subunit [Salmonella enterica subsp. enterica serovar Cerro]|nr:iron chelate uptake ABC transporter family permease subunit [Salmonella enterica subsp. enterica serovar Cerro]
MTCQDKSLLAPALASTPVIPRYRQIIRKRAVLMLAIALAMMASLMVDVTCGSSGLPLSALWQALFQPEKVNAGIHVIVWDIRLPYALMALLVGMALGLAGAEMQTILNNPLATPFTLGVSSAAAFGAALAIVLGIGIPGIPAAWFIPANAFIFALLSALLLDGITRWTGVAASGVVLFGIALVFTFNALVAIMQFVADEDTLQGLVFWTMGSLVRASWEKLGVLAVVFIAVLFCALRSAWQLTALRLGEERAMSFGIHVRRLRLLSLLRISLLSALTVAFVGPIGFIGLVAPHIARILLGEDHRFYLPGSVLIGGLVLSLASIAAKNSVPGVMVPVGIVTSLAGLNNADGEALLDGEDLMSLSFAERAQKVVFLPQSLPQGVHLHVLESIIVVLRASGGRDNAQGRAQILAILEQLGITHLALQYLDQLSGGQRQLVGLAQSLIRRPELLLLDEPLSALDLNYQFHVMDLVRRDTQAQNRVTIVVAHDINIALRHGDHVLMLKDGRLVASGAPETVITAERLAEVYRVRGRVERCSQGKLQVVLDGVIAV